MIVSKGSKFYNSFALFSGGRDGLQGHAHAEEKTRQESCGGKYACAAFRLLFRLEDRL